MTFSEKLKELLDQSIKASKEIAKQANDKAQQWGELGVIKLELAQLKNQSEKLTAKLGAEVYSVLVEKGQKTVSKESSAIKEIIDKIEEIEAQIALKESAFKKAGGKEEEV